MPGLSLFRWLLPVKSNSRGDRRIARLEASWDAPAPRFETVADRFDGHRLNSPNDLIFDSRVTADDVLLRVRLSTRGLGF